MSPTAFVQGASRGIGLEFVRQLLSRADTTVIATCRDPGSALALASLVERFRGRLEVLALDLSDERTIEDTSARVAERCEDLDLILNVAGVLHAPGVFPEKKLAQIDPQALRTVFEVNAFGPLLVAKHFHRFLRHSRRSVFASLSARVGSISDNRLGGWYAYRGSKAAQNMFTKTIAVELGRVCPQAIVLGLHPGTVDTDLSRPFQRGVRPEALLTTTESVKRLLDVVDRVGPGDTGKVFDFRGDEILP